MLKDKISTAETEMLVEILQKEIESLYDEIGNREFGLQFADGFDLAELKETLGFVKARLAVVEALADKVAN